jgi:hypothetical protein
MLLAQHIVDRLTHSKCDIERLEQSRVAEWLEQALDRTLFEHSRAHCLISLSGDKDNWNLLPTKFQFLLKAGPGHSGHRNVGPANWLEMGQVPQLRNWAVSRASLQPATHDGHPA